MRKKQKNRYVAIGAGGTGGHVFPAISIAKKLIENNYRVLFFTDKRALNYIKQYKDIINDPCFTLILLSSGNSSRIKQCLTILKDLWTCKIIIRKGVSLCIGFGGIVSFPVILFGILTLRKTIIHESNAILGLANRILLPFVNYCLTSFEETKKIPTSFKKRKILCTGTPIRDEIKKYIYQYDNPSVNYRFFYKIEDTINLTILGGSQASNIFDTIIPDAICMLSNNIANKLNIIHQCRIENIDKILTKYISNGITSTVKPFFENIGDIMRRSHLIIARAGASTISEITAIGAPSILIPLPTAADNHQYENAKILSNKNATILLEQKELTPERLADALNNLFTHDILLSEMSAYCLKCANFYADIKIIAIINKILGYENHIEIKSNLSNPNYINRNTGIG